MPRRPAPGLLSPLVLLGLVLVTLLAGAPALAAGTGGIDVTPIPAFRDGKAVTSFRVTLPSDGTTEVPFTLRNVTQQPRSARVYLAPVSRNDGNFVLGRPGESPYASLADREVTLVGGEVREESFTVDGSDQPDGEVLAAVVVEVTNGAVTTQASTLVYLTPARVLPLPLLLVLGAVLLLAVAGVGVVVVGRRRPAREDEPASAAA